MSGYASKRAASTGVGRKGGLRVGREVVLEADRVDVLPFGWSAKEDILDRARVLDAGDSMASARDRGRPSMEAKVKGGTRRDFRDG